MTRTVAVAEFEARCLELLEEIAGTGNDLVVTRDGRPFAKVVSIQPSLRGPMYGTIEILGDIVEPIDTDWDDEVIVVDTHVENDLVATPLPASSRTCLVYTT